MSTHIRRCLAVLLLASSLASCTSWSDYACGPARWAYQCPGAKPGPTQAERR
jgi:hypothetical protein